MSSNSIYLRLARQKVNLQQNVTIGVFLVTKSMYIRGLDYIYLHYFYKYLIRYSVIRAFLICKEC